MSPYASPDAPRKNEAPPLIRANKLDLLERLADDLAHEIKNPLHSMVINLEVLKRRVTHAVPDGSSEVLRYIGVLNTELERVNRSIELLLRLARPARGSESTTVNELIEEVLELLQLEARHHNVSVQFEPAAEVLRVNVPRDPARQVILNLVLDTVDAADAGDTVVIRTGREAGRAQVIVAGAGIREADGVLMTAAKALGESLGGDVHEGATLVFSLPLRG